MARLIASLAAALLLTVPGFARDIRVIDGDTFDLDGQFIHLWGFDALELDQTCIAGGGGEVHIGSIAADTLAALLGGLKECEVMTVDEAGQTFAWCTLDDTTDVAWHMVASGLAFGLLQVSGGHYIDAEAVAYEGQFGHWRYRCVPPWVWLESDEG
ncbi:MAG: hypothetical protein AAGG65_16495 [Pseudomonadota bacterium]